MRVLSCLAIFAKNILLVFVLCNCLIFVDFQVVAQSKKTSTEVKKSEPSQENKTKQTAKNTSKTVLIARTLSKDGVKEMKPVKVILDAGHGGYDPGKEKTHSKFQDEKHIVLAITKKLHNIMLKRMIGAEAILTRKRDTYVKLEERVKITNEEDADIFVSIHCNSNPNREIHGTQMHIHSNAFKKSKKLAHHLDKSFQNTANRKSLGLFTNKDRGFPLYVLQNVKPASVLIEVGFISNREEEEFLNSDEGQDLVADTILQGLLTFMKAENYDVHLLPKNEKETKEVLAKNTTENAKKLIKEIEEATKKYEKAKAEDIEAAKKVKTIYRVQISSSKQPITMNHYDFSKLIAKNYKIDEVVTEDEKNAKRYRYLVGKADNMEAAQLILQDVKKYNFKDAFITSFEQ